jgi:hypothetical protein
MEKNAIGEEKTTVDVRKDNAKKWQSTQLSMFVVEDDKCPEW